MLAIRLPAELEARLTELAQKTGRTRSLYARMKDFKPGEGIPLEQVMAELGLED